MVQERILSFLRKKDEWISTSKIAYVTRLNYFQTVEVLEIMYKKGIIKKEDVGKATYWRVDNGHKKV